MTDVSALTVSGLISSALLGTGAVAFFVRYGTRLALLEKLVETSQLITLHPRLNRVEDAIHELKLVKEKLNTLDVIANKLGDLADLMKSVVPRTEHEVRWEANERRFENIETDIARHKS